jgi:hypothetical protein
MEENYAPKLDIAGVSMVGLSKFDVSCLKYNRVW